MLAGREGIRPLGESDDQVASLPGESTHGDIKEIAADGIEYDICALVRSQRLDSLSKIFSDIVDGFACALQ